MSASTSLPPDVFPRPSSGPQPPPSQPFFFNLGSSNKTRICRLGASPFGAPLNITDGLRSSASQCCGGIGIWNDALSACRIETLAKDEKFIDCVDKVQANAADCVGYGLYAEAMTDEAWKWLEWPEKWDNGTLYIATVLGAENGTLQDFNVTTAEACCAKVGGTYSLNVSTPNGKKERREEKENRPGPGPDQALVKEGMYPPCLIPKAQDAAYRQCILDVEPNAFVMVASWTPYRNGTWVEDPGEKPDDEAGGFSSSKAAPNATSRSASPSDKSSTAKLGCSVVLAVVGALLSSIV